MRTTPNCGLARPRRTIFSVSKHRVARRLGNSHRRRPSHPARLLSDLRALYNGRQWRSGGAQDRKAINSAVCLTESYPTCRRQRFKHSAARGGVESNRYLAVGPPLNQPKLTEWLGQQLPALEGLAALEFAQPVHERFFDDVGWRIVRESWYPDTCFEIHFPDVQRRLVALYDDGHQEIGIGLYALANPRESHEYILESIADFHGAFHRMLAVMQRRLAASPSTGAYHYSDHEIDYNYATWDYHGATLILVQHHEGDGHLAHEASLDIRVRPGISTQPAYARFPLVTNMLF
jgi:hypothetical protein